MKREMVAESNQMIIALIIKNTHDQTGIGRVGLNVVKEFSNAGNFVKMVSEGGDYEGDHLQVDFTLKNPFLILRNVYRIACYIKNADLLIAYDVKPAGIYTYLASLFIGKKYILHCIGTYSLFTSEDAWFKRWIMTKVYKNAEKVLFLSSSVRAAIAGSVTLPGVQETGIVPPGVMTQTFFKVSEKSELLPPSVTSYMVTVGAIKKRKGHDISIDAFFEVAEQFPDLQYVIVGDMADTEYCKRITKKVTDSKFGDRVHFLQGVSDEELRRLYSNAEFFIMTPRTTQKYIEGFGIVYLEAASCGLTSIGTQETGAGDAIVDGLTGVLCSVQVSDVAGAIKSILLDNEFKQVLEEAAEINAKRYTWKNIIQNYKQINT